MSHRDFPITPTQYDRPTFSLADEEFIALPDPPGGALADLFWAYQGDVTAQAAGVVRFIEGCLPDDEADRFLKVIHDKETIVPLAVLSDIHGWLMEQYTDRPTTPSSGSGNGSTPMPATPGDGAGSPELTSADQASSS